MEYYYKIQLFVKDQVNLKDTNLYVIFLCTLQGNGKEFFKKNLGTTRPTEKDIRELKVISKKMTRPHSFLDAVVVETAGPQKHPIFFLVDTELTIQFTSTVMGFWGFGAVSYTHLDAADDTPCVDLGGRRIIKKKNKSLKQTV
eukprot:TRINITY_DN25979_c0_g1_i2.p1 TRINITY_DN25979_c0_g1~~TRINITY_DN25979_c0_g1_i2.p1  ORF type:complete len:143 (+),score=27.18 TRINITY_DN25979_c0_g1_i2:317-745(+)